MTASSVDRSKDVMVHILDRLDDELVSLEMRETIPSLERLEMIWSSLRIDCSGWKTRMVSSPDEVDDMMVPTPERSEDGLQNELVATAYGTTWSPPRTSWRT